jgi:hypothetical protein
MSKVGKATSLEIPGPTEVAGKIPKWEARFNVASLASPTGTFPVRIAWAGSGIWEWPEEGVSTGTVVPMVAAAPSTCLLGCCACSRASRRCSILSFHLNSNRQIGHTVSQDKAYEASSSSNICKLLLTVHDSPRVLQRAHGEPLVATLHLTFKMNQRVEPSDHRPHHCTFSFRQDTHAVIFLLMSGGLRSPNDSRSADAADGRDILNQATQLASSSLRTTKRYAV